ncbi:MAG: type II toxin-antitoxin system PemK/MazF family toxin [Nocardioidaceae bacterium]
MSLLGRLRARLGRSTPAPSLPRVRYRPRRNGRPDPGEIVWAWVPFEDDPRQGKDRPVLLLAKHQGRWLGLMLTSKDHDVDAAQEARFGRHWMDIGSGPWDARRRPSEVRLDRLLELDPRLIRREGAALDQATFERVLAGARAHHRLG